MRCVFFLITLPLLASQASESQVVRKVTKGQEGSEELPSPKTVAVAPSGLIKAHKGASDKHRKRHCVAWHDSGRSHIAAFATRGEANSRYASLTNDGNFAAVQFAGSIIVTKFGALTDQEWQTLYLACDTEKNKGSKMTWKRELAEPVLPSKGPQVPNPTKIDAQPLFAWARAEPKVFSTGAESEKAVAPLKPKTATHAVASASQPKTPSEKLALLARPPPRHEQKAIKSNKGPLPPKETPSGELVLSRSDDAKVDEIIKSMTKQKAKDGQRYKKQLTTKNRRHTRTHKKPARRKGQRQIQLAHDKKAVGAELVHTEAQVANVRVQEKTVAAKLEKQLSTMQREEKTIETELAKTKDQLATVLKEIHTMQHPPRARRSYGVFATAFVVILILAGLMFVGVCLRGVLFAREKYDDMEVFSFGEIQSKVHDLVPSQFGDMLGKVHEKVRNIEIPSIGDTFRRVRDKFRDMDATWWTRAESRTQTS